MAEIIDYDDFPTLVPTSSNQVVGVVTTDNICYCRHCMMKLHMGFEDTKYITRTKAKEHIYNCVACGWRITKKRMYKYSTKI